jgi:hypothetical protein
MSARYRSRAVRPERVIGIDLDGTTIRAGLAAALPGIEAIAGLR